MNPSATKHVRSSARHHHNENMIRIAVGHPTEQITWPRDIPTARRLGNENRSYEHDYDGGRHGQPMCPIVLQYPAVLDMGMHLEVTGTASN
jgi:hypothetical protein